MPKYERLGVTDERTDCDCCGRQNLKATVAMLDRESDEIVYFGRFCAARAEGWGVKQSDGGRLVTQVKKHAEEVRRRLSALQCRQPENIEANEIFKANTPIFQLVKPERQKIFDQMKALRSVGDARARQQLLQEMNLRDEALDLILKTRY